MTTPLLGEEQWDNIMPTYFIPPREDRPFQSPRALLFSEEDPGRDDETGLPKRIAPINEIVNREAANPDKISGFIIQISQSKQFAYAQDTIFQAIDCRIDPIEDRAPSQGNLILPGQNQPKNYSNKVVYRIEIDFYMQPVHDVDIINKIKELTWNKI